MEVVGQILGWSVYMGNISLLGILLHYFFTHVFGPDLVGISELSQILALVQSRSFFSPEWGDGCGGREGSLENLTFHPLELVES